MALPSQVSTTHLDSGSDDPVQARAEIAAIGAALNALITHVATLPTLANVGSAATKDIGQADGEVPLNAMLESGAHTPVGSGPTEIPLNQDLGTAAGRDIGNGDDQVPLNVDIGTVAALNFGATHPDDVSQNSDLGTACRHDVDELFEREFDGRVLQLGAFRLWVDNHGSLRMKDGVPTDHLDGDYIGGGTPPQQDPDPSP